VDRVASHCCHFIVSTHLISGSMTDDVVWLLPATLELECSVYPLSLSGITSSQAGVPQEISRAFADIEK
jgi:hypothetical protein